MVWIIHRRRNGLGHPWGGQGEEIAWIIPLVGKEKEWPGLLFLGWARRRNFLGHPQGG